MGGGGVKGEEAKPVPINTISKNASNSATNDDWGLINSNTANWRTGSFNSGNSRGSGDGGSSRGSGDGGSRGVGGRGLHAFPFQLSLSSSVHRITQLHS